MNRKAWVEALQYIFLLAVVILNIIGLVKIQTIIDENQQSTLAARQANMDRQDKIINHIDCVLLLNKKYPNVNFQTLSYDDSKAYLDKCAKT